MIKNTVRSKNKYRSMGLEVNVKIKINEISSKRVIREI